MHPNGQLPAYEWNFGDVNPPVHAGPRRRVYEIDAAAASRPALPRAGVPQALAQLHLVGQPQADQTGRHLFSGRLPRARQHRRLRPLQAAARSPATSSRPTAPPGWPTSPPRCSRSPWSSRATTRPTKTWPASSSSTSSRSSTAINTLDGTGLWDEEDGFYYDHLHCDGRMVPLKCRSIVGLCRCSPWRHSTAVRSTGCRPSAAGSNGSPATGPSRRRISTCPQAGDRRALPALGVSRPSGSSGSCAAARRGRSSSRPTASGRCRGPTRRSRSCSRPAAWSTAWPTCRARPMAACSAATPTGGARSGCR